MILDSRYPLLAENEDGSVIAMLHSIISTIEVKTNIISKDIKKMWRDSIKIMGLASEIKGYGSEEFTGIITRGFAYKCANKLDTLENKYIEAALPKETALDIYILRLHSSDQIKEKNIGVEFHFEPVDKLDDDYKDSINGYVPTCRPTFNPLSDLYYTIIQDSYYTIGRRQITYTNLGEHIMDYLSWSTCTWDKYWELKNSASKKITTR